MFNHNKLRGLIAERCGTQQMYAQILGITGSTLSKKISRGGFTQSEIDKSRRFFGLTDKLTIEVFFTREQPPSDFSKGEED